MAENKNESLIGFDPLAWMDDESEDKDASKKTDTVNAKKQAEAKIEEGEVKLEQENADDIQVILESTLNIQNVAVLYDQLKKLLDHQNKIEIDASAVTMIDTANLQLLGVLKQTAVKLHKEVIIDFPSEKFIESAKLLGLSEILDVDQAASGFF